MVAIFAFEAKAQCFLQSATQRVQGLHIACVLQPLVDGAQHEQGAAWEYLSKFTIGLTSCHIGEIGQDLHVTFPAPDVAWIA